VTTPVMGHCRVGFAPLREGPKAKSTTDLIDLMQGVEDIPGVVLAEGVRFDWESYLGTWVAGQCVQRDGQLSEARRGALVRAGR
jgi:N-acyl-D-aspartate/D-glutamate deacylase